MKSVNLYCWPWGSINTDEVILTTPIVGTILVRHINCNLNEVIDSTLVQELKEWSKIDTNSKGKDDNSVQFENWKLEISLEWS